MKLPERLEDLLYHRALPKALKDARVFVRHGDNHWGCQISSVGEAKRRSGRLGNPLGLEIRVGGHLRTRPRRGDLLLVKMATGQWAYFVFSEVELKYDPPDMFFASARGPLRYATPEEEPQTDYADEFVSGRRPAKPKLPEGAAPPESYAVGEEVLLDGAAVTVAQHVFDGLLLKHADGHETTVDRSEMDRVKHIPEPVALETGPKGRVSPLAG